MHVKPRMRYWICGLAIIAGSMLVLSTGLVADYIGYLRAWATARGDYASQRGELGSAAWHQVSRGIGFGMTETEVDKLMAGAVHVIRHAPQSEPRWDGYVNIYEFNYGSARRFPGGKTEYIVQETYWVYFDKKGRASKLTRYLFERGRDHPVLDVDLAKKRIRTWPPTR